ncbi:bleomycin resistance protein [Microvirga sp. TS319]|uniref:bleomycin resistance protein n=1 Tax=Microvirga sp. TS319 TaxID=3241165 RepID=UPI00351AA0A0
MTLPTSAERNLSSGTGRLPEGGFNALVPELDVTDIDASLRFWCGLLGFAVAYDRPQAKFAYLQREGAQVMLCQINRNWEVGALERPFGRGINFQIAARDIDPVVNALREAGWPLYREPFEAWYRLGDDVESGSREFLVQDPDGYLIRFAQNMGRKKLTE